MKILGDKDNFRIVIEPRGMTEFGHSFTTRSALYGDGEKGQRQWEEDMKWRCEDMIEQIRRHVDNVRWASIEFDQEAVCSHCGSKWSGDSDTYNGGCCDKDEQHNPTGYRS